MSAISFYGNKPVQCPSCQTSFRREVLRSGGGRLIAGDLMPDLRRTYKPSPKFGDVNPLIFNVVVCPNCLYSALPEDYLMVGEDIRAALKATTKRRQKYLKMIFGNVDFSQERTLAAGAASFFLAVSSYSSYTKDFAPTTKKAICAVRASWLVSDLNKLKPGAGFDKIYWYFRYLAWTLYEAAIQHAQNGEETFDKVSSLGPDIDMNYGYDGAMYMLAYLGLEQSAYLREEESYEKLKYYRLLLSKVFGFGKISKDKPSPLVNTAKDLHKDLTEKLSVLEAKYGA